MFGRKHHDDADPPPSPVRPRWTDLPHECPDCGAVIDQAEACVALTPRCHYCEVALPCTAVPEAAGTTWNHPHLDKLAAAAISHQANAIYGPGGALEQWARTATSLPDGDLVDSHAYLRTAGVPSYAFVRGWEKLGVYDSRGMLMSLHLDLPSGDGSTLAVVTNTFVPDEYRHILADGMQVHVRVDQANPTQVLVIWD